MSSYITKSSTSTTFYFVQASKNREQKERTKFISWEKKLKTLNLNKIYCSTKHEDLIKNSNIPT